MPALMTATKRAAAACGNRKRGACFPGPFLDLIQYIKDVQCMAKMSIYYTPKIHLYIE